MNFKFLKYFDNFNCNMPKIALLIDPLSSNASSDMLDMKEIVRFKFKLDHGLPHDARESLDSCGFYCSVPMIPLIKSTTSACL
jgi:hypothetical protein